ncbi:MAG: hypothetical protein H6Q69_1810 [Firmicutes bacterium]|nr:hypothetical protein [Bacillota bacterium]
MPKLREKMMMDIALQKFRIQKTMVSKWSEQNIIVIRNYLL